MFLIVEVVRAARSRLLIALIRTVSLPALFPLKLICIVFVDVMRGVPTILLIYLVGFGVPALNLSGVPTSATVLGGIALDDVLLGVRVRGVPRRHPVGPPEPGRRGARARADPDAGAASRHRSAGRAARRSRRCSTTSSRCRRTSRWSRSSGRRRRSGSPRSTRPQYFNYTPLIAAALLYLCVTIPLTRIFDHMQARTLRERGSALALGPR